VGAGDTSERESGLACDDGGDGDGDGEGDFPDDPGCDDAFDSDEKSPLLVCDDGSDNDLDGMTDVPMDPGCAAPDDGSEQSADLDCDDGIDNDFDGLVDVADPACAASTSPTENPQCDDDIDNDDDLKVDWDGGQFGLPPDPQCTGRPWRDNEAMANGGGCGLGFELLFALVPLAALRRRRLQS